VWPRQKIEKRKTKNEKNQIPTKFTIKFLPPPDKMMLPCYFKRATNATIDALVREYHDTMIVAGKENPAHYDTYFEHMIYSKENCLGAFWHQDTQVLAYALAKTHKIPPLCMAISHQAKVFHFLSFLCRGAGMFPENWSVVNIRDEHQEKKFDIYDVEFALQAMRCRLPLSPVFKELFPKAGKAGERFMIPPVYDLIEFHAIPKPLEWYFEHEGKRYEKEPVRFILRRHRSAEAGLSGHSRDERRVAFLRRFIPLAILRYIRRHVGTSHLPPGATNIAKERMGHEILLQRVEEERRRRAESESDPQSKKPRFH
jgi:hypothetical protein